MAKSKSSKKDKSSRRKLAPPTIASVLQSISKAPKQPMEPPTESTTSMLSRAQDLFHVQSLPREALELITLAIQQSPTSLPALGLAGEINVDLGDISTAVKCFERAVELDVDGLEDGPEKFLWLAQLCEEGGEVAIAWYERGVELLRRWIAEGGKNNGADGEDRGLEGKLCSALCGMAEIYMTDLCMAPDAESRCETYVTEALLVSPSSPEALQTLASIRISQQRSADAQTALSRSYNLWKDLDSDNANIPAYPTRLSFTRLLIETEMYDEAMEVLERLQQEDDQVVDLWYIGGWCLYLIGQKAKEVDHGMNGTNGVVKDDAIIPNGEADADEDGEDDLRELWQASRDWLQNCEKLYQALEWEDEGIAQHTTELLNNIKGVLGEPADEIEGDDAPDEVGWEDDDEEGDEEMEDT